MTNNIHVEELSSNFPEIVDFLVKFRLFYDVAYDDFHFIDIKWFGQVIISTDFHSPNSGFCCIIRGQHNDLCIDSLAFQLFEYIDPVSFRESDIQQDDVRGPGLYLIDDIVCSGLGMHRMAFVLQRPGEHRDDESVIIDNKDPSFDTHVNSPLPLVSQGE